MKKLIWHVDHDQLMQLAVQMTLLRENYEYVGFTTPKTFCEAWSAAKESGNLPDLIITELGPSSIEEGDYDDIVRRVREESETPIIVVSILGGDAAVILAMTLKYDGYLLKPFEHRELVLMVNRFFRSDHEGWLH